MLKCRASVMFTKVLQAPTTLNPKPYRSLIGNLIDPFKGTPNFRKLQDALRALRPPNP